jgi:hypothetical protein
LYASQHWNVIVFLFSCVRLQGTTKEPFVANVIWLALEHCQLFIDHHTTKAIEAATKYHTNMAIPSSLCS